jgi:hypothetical protein
LKLISFFSQITLTGIAQIKYYTQEPLMHYMNAIIAAAAAPVYAPAKTANMTHHQAPCVCACSP